MENEVQTMITLIEHVATGITTSSEAEWLRRWAIQKMTFIAGLLTEAGRDNEYQTFFISNLKNIDMS